MAKSLDQEFPLKEEVCGDETYLIDTIMPDYIVAHSGRKFGEPTIIGTRLPCETWYLEDPEGYGIPREQALVAAAFHYGRLWQRSRKRRQRMEQVVKALWDRFRAEKKAKNG